jgi:PIN domain nuclease of toxin-antitoxin system
VRLLLDTNILIPMVDGNGRKLPAGVLALLQRDDVDLWASAASVWEVAIKHRLQKLPLPCPLPEWPLALTSLNVMVMPVRIAHTVAEPELPLETKDPFDRLLIAICGLEMMQLVTLDKALLDHPLAWRPASA